MASKDSSIRRCGTISPPIFEKRLSRPVMCTCGTRSAMTMVRVTRKLADTFPTGVFRQIEAAGHAAPFDAPSEFVRVVQDVIA